MSDAKGQFCISIVHRFVYPMLYFIASFDSFVVYLSNSINRVDLSMIRGLHEPFQALTFTWDNICGMQGIERKERNSSARPQI